MKITIAGDGKWGKALFSVAKENHGDVSFWNREDKISSDVLILSVPTPAIRSIFPFISKRKVPIIVNASKGVEEKTYLLPCQIVSDAFQNCSYCTLVGPGFAKDVTCQMPTIVNLGFRQEYTALYILPLLQTKTFRVRMTPGVEALELAGALKNVYAIACGFSEGLGFAESTRAKLIVLALEEFYDLCHALSLRVDRAATVGILGDFILTGTSSQSRNYRFGKLLARREPNAAFQEIGETVEGFNTSFSIPYFIEKSGLQLPLAELVGLIVSGEKRNIVKKQFLRFLSSV